MKKILIYDDNITHGEELAKLLEDATDSRNTRIDIADNITAAQRLTEENSYAVVFLDIELDTGISGIDIGVKIREKQKTAALVFITAYIRYCEEIFLASPDAFLLKPVSAVSVKRTLDIISSKHKSEDHIVIGTGRNNIDTVSLENIVTIETLSRRLIFFGEEHKPLYSFYDIKLLQIEQKMPEYFVRCHQSIIVNMRMVTRLERYFFVTKSGSEVPISQSRFADTRQAYLSFLGDKL